MVSTCLGYFMFGLFCTIFIVNCSLICKYAHVWQQLSIWPCRVSDQRRALKSCRCIISVEQTFRSRENQCVIQVVICALRKQTIKNIVSLTFTYINAHTQLCWAFFIMVEFFLPQAPHLF